MLPTIGARRRLENSIVMTWWYSTCIRSREPVIPRYMVQYKSHCASLLRPNSCWLFHTCCATAYAVPCSAEVKTQNRDTHRKKDNAHHAGLTGQSSISRDLEHPQLAVQWPSGHLSSRAVQVQDRVRVKPRARARGQGQCTRDWRQGCPGPGSIDGGSVPCCLRCQTSPLFYSLVSCLEMDKLGRRQTRFPAVSVIHSAQLSETNRARGQSSPV